jgi:pterin-4a-carbinolamine dehydratase
MYLKYKVMTPTSSTSGNCVAYLSSAIEHHPNFENSPQHTTLQYDTKVPPSA